MTPSSIRLLALAPLLLAACKEAASPAAAPAPPAVQLATDLNDGLIETASQQMERSNGPRVERVAGMRAGVSALPGVAGAPVALAAGAPVALDGGAAPGPAAEAPAGPRGDVRWDDEPYGAIAAAARGELLPIPASAADVPPLWKDPAGTWVAVGGRAVVLLVAVDELGEHGAPVRFTALTEGWLKGKVAMPAPTGGAALAHFAALFEAWGAERMEAWLSGLKANEVQLYATDDEVRKAVVSGRAVVGVLSSDEAAKAAASAAHVLVVYPNQRSIGTFVWPTALSVPKSAKDPAAAQQVAERLGSRAMEQLLVARVPGYLPLRADIPVPPGVRSAANLVVISVDPGHIVEEIGRRKAQLALWSASIPKPAAVQAAAAAPPAK